MTITDPYRVEYVEQPDNAIWSAIGGGISDYNTRQAGSDHGKNLCFVLYDSQGEIAGGLIGATYWDWFYVNLLWLPEELRGRGYGRRLMHLAEDEARRRGAKHAYLDTFTFQTPGFYLRHGYHVFGELKDFPPGHVRYFMTKDL